MNDEMRSGVDALPDLYVYTGSGWTGGICLSSSAGDRDQGGPFTSDDCLYLSFAVANGGQGAAGPFAASVFVDGRMVYALEYDIPLEGRKVAFAESVRLDALAAGSHDITIVCDNYGSVAESDEGNNIFTRTIDILAGETEPGTYLLDTLWAQRGSGRSSYGYNRFVPEGLRTGCTSVALGQILRYWDGMGYGISLHVESGDYFDMATSGADFRVTPENMDSHCGVSEYELDNLLTDAVFGTANWDDDGTIAALQLAGMLAMHSTVEDDVTGTLSSAAQLLLERAGFDFERVVCSGDVPWERVRENMADGMPVLAGLGGDLMHTVVIDGYSPDTGRYHVNFGWGAEDERRRDGRYGMEAGTGWYTQEQMDAFEITSAVLDIHPLYEANDAEVSTLDWSRKVYAALEPDCGYLVTISRDGEWAVTTDVSQSGVNVLTTQEGLVVSVESFTGIALERSRKVETALPDDGAPALLESPGNGLADIFFARPDGVWENDYMAQNCATGEIAVMTAMNRFRDIFRSGNAASILHLTDDSNGDAFFADDIYTDSYNGMGREAARLSGIREIRAGAGDDIVDLTSFRFDCGDGIAVRGGAGDDVLWGGGCGCVLFGEDGNDRLAGTAGDDIIAGGSGNDEIQCLGGDDVLCFGLDWGDDVVLQEAGGRLTLWFAAGDAGCWDAEVMRYDDGKGSVSVSGGVSAADVFLRFGDDGDAAYGRLKELGGFLA